MTREELIEMLNILLNNAKVGCADITALHHVSFDSFKFVIEQTIKALSQEPCEDAISRDAAINIASLHCLTIDESVKALEQLPPVNPQPSEHFIDGVHAIGYREGYKDAQKQKSGEWIITPMSNIAYCSECDYLFKDVPASMVEHFKHCPNCGTKMESEAE